MNKSVKKLSVDMGNSTICVAGVNENGDVIKEYVNSVYSLDTALMSGDIVEYNGVSISLGVGHATLTNVDKTNREHVEHQILWSAYAVYGSGTHYVNLGVGLPISIYKAKRGEYTDKLKALGTIEGTINGKPISVNMVDVKVFAEGHASIKSLSNYIDKDNTTLLIDIGMKTTDVLLIEWDGKFKINSYATVNIALYDIYKVLQNEIAQNGVEVSIEDINKKFNSKKPVIRTEKGDFNLYEHLADTVHVCRDIMKDIENKFGKTILHDKVFTGGGSEKFLKAIEGKVKNNIDVPTDMRYYSNAVGYLLGI